MLSRARNGYDAVTVETALHGGYGSRQVRPHHAVIDANTGELIRYLSKVNKCLVRMQAKDNAIPRTASYEIILQDLTLDPHDDLLAAASAVAFWVGNEASGTTLADTSGNARTMTLNGGFTLLRPSLLVGDGKTSFSLNGTTGYGSVLHTNDFNPVNNKLGTGLYIKGSVTGLFQTLMARDDGSANRQFDFFTDNNGKLGLALYFTTGAPGVYQSDVVVLDGKSHRLRWKYTGSFVELWVDSILVLKQAETRTLNTITLALNVGRRNDNARFFNGQMNRIDYFNRAVTVAEDRLWFQAGRRDLREFDPNRDQIRPEYGIVIDEALAKATNNEQGVAWFPLGLLEIIKESVPIGATGNKLVAEFGDQTVTLDNDTIIEPLFFAAGTLYTAAMQEVVESAGILNHNITASTLALQSDLEFLPTPEGLSKREILSTLSTGANYDTWFDPEGVWQAHEDVDPADQAVDYIYSDVKDGHKNPVVIRGSLKTEIERLSIINIFTAYVENPDRPLITATARNDDINSPTSTWWRSRNGKPREVDASERVEAPDLTTAQAIADRRLRERSNPFQTIPFNTPVMPFHTRKNKLRLINAQGAILGDLLEVEWQIDMVTGGDMYHLGELLQAAA